MPKSRGSASEKVRRDVRIVADRARGLRWATIAERHGVSERQCRTVWAEHRDQRLTGHDADPESVVHHALESFEAAIEDFALLAESASHDAVKLGAIKARLAATTERLEFMKMVGLLGSFRTLEFELDARRTVEEIIKVLERHNVGEDVFDEIKFALDGQDPSANGHHSP
ncbi:MAG: hypothetical protein WKF96_24015 [Solirubrobacteraceae bacterium]